MAFNPFTFELPIKEVLNDILEKLRSQNTLILHAPPGAGKSTLVPLALHQANLLQGQKILMLEPRRLAAKSIAHRMSQLLGESIGTTVGYRIRLESRIGPETKIEVLTEGVLTRMLQEDNGLEGVGLVIFDEFHERSIHADLALALCRQSQDILRPDLKLMIMSATLPAQQLAHLLKAPVVESQGRQYPVKIQYADHKPDPALIPEMMAQAIQLAFKEEEGDILAFFPGEGEIRACEALLKKAQLPLQIHPLYGALPMSAQQAAILPDRKGRRKVVLATSIAETSLTIEGIKSVVDCGFSRRSVFDPRSGLSKLETLALSQDVADQRAGRAGRLGPGTAYRLWTLASHEHLEKQRQAEILIADLSALALELLAWGIEEPDELLWLDPPPKGPWLQALSLLENLDAIEKGKITPHGRKIHSFPCHPRIAHMLLSAQKEEEKVLACDLAAILEEKDPLGRDHGNDIQIRIEHLHRYRSESRLFGPWNKIEKVAAQYRQLLKIQLNKQSVDPFSCGFLIAQAYPERIACARPGNQAQFQLANGRLAFMHHKEDLAHESWLAIAHMDAGRGKIFMAACLDPRDLASKVKENKQICWDHRKGEIEAKKEWRLGQIVLKSQALSHVSDEERLAVLLNVIQGDGGHLLPWDDAAIQIQNRVLSARNWKPDQGWPDFRLTSLLSTSQEWLAPYLSGVKSAQDLKKLNLGDILIHHLNPEQQAWLKENCPSSVEVPSGSQIRLQYQEDGSAPVLAVRLQELFGMEQSPKVNQGQVKVLLHLLSPGFKPVQVTNDLESFWNQTYFEVRKELKRRYPKHAWPEDPRNAEALRGPVKKREKK